MKPSKRSCLMLATAVLAGCMDKDRTESYSVSAPIASAHSSGSTLVVYPAPDTDWQRLVDLGIFGALKPGETFENCVRRAGEPQERGRDRRGEFYAYVVPSGMVRIAHEESRSGLGGVSRAWVLRAIPKAMRLAQLFHPEVVRLLEQTRSPITTVTIMRSTASNPAMHVEVADGKVVSVTWLPETAIP